MSKSKQVNPKLRLTVEVEYQLNDDSLFDLESRLRDIVVRAFDEGLFTGDGSAEVGGYSAVVKRVDSSYLRAPGEHCESCDRRFTESMIDFARCVCGSTICLMTNVQATAIKQGREGYRADLAKKKGR